MMQLVLRDRRITRGVVERATGKHFPATVEMITKEDIKRILKKNGWGFNWKREYLNMDRKVYKLLVEGSADIQSLISIEAIPYEQYLELHLIENAPINRGQYKKYIGLARYLVSYACKMSFEMGFGGVVAFRAKTELIEHYINTLSAQLIFGNNRMMIDTEDAKKLVNLHFNTSSI